MKKKWIFGLVMPICAAFLLVSCPSNDDGGDITKPPPDITKISLNGNPIKNYVYIEVVDTDPRVAMGYELQRSGKPFFDYVVLFSATIRDRNCAVEPNTSHEPPVYVNGKDTHNCTKNGLHVHWDANIDHLLQNRNKYIKPLQDKGIKVLLGLLGDWSGVDLSTLGEWPFEDVSPVAGPGHPGEQGSLGSEPPPAWKKDGVAHYPYGPEERRKWLEEVKGVLALYNLDGIDFDDEWGNSGPGEYQYLYPGGGSLTMYEVSLPVYNYYPNNPAGAAKALAIRSKNMAELVVEAREVLGPDRIITMYEFGGGRDMPETITWNGKTVRVSDYFDASANAFYGSWQQSTNKTPSEKYSPVSMDVGGADQPQARPPMSMESSGLESRMQAVLDGNYGVLCYYCLLSRDRYEGNRTNFSGDTLKDMSNFYKFGGVSNKPEDYFSVIANTLYGEEVVYRGNDYPQDWKKISH